MAIEIRHGVRNDLLIAVAAKFLRAHSSKGEVVVAAGTREAADDFVRSFAIGALTGVHRTTVEHLAAAIAQHTLRSREFGPLGSIAREAIAGRVIERAREAGKLAYFTPVAGFPGFARALARTLEDLRLGGIPAARLMLTGGPCLDLAYLLELYEDELVARKLADQELRFTTAMDVESHALCGLPLLFLDAPVTNAAASSFVAEIAKKSPSVLVVTQSAAVDAWEALLGIAGQGIEADGESGLHSAQRYLFSREVIPATAADETCRLFAAPGPAIEAVEIARILRDAAREGMPFDEMAILMRKPGHYQQVMEEALRRAKIPAWFTRGTRRPDASGRAFLALLYCACEGLPASRFAEYLSLGQAPNREDGEVRAPAGWEKLIVDAAVIGGPERWGRRLNGLEAELRARYESQPESDESARERLRRDLDRLSELKEFALPLIERLAAVPKQATWAEWLRIIEELAGCSLRKPDVVYELIDELQILNDAPQSEPLETVVRTLEPHLRFLREQPEGHRYGRVFVGSIEEARGMRFRLVSIPGLNEGEFPRLISGDPLLSDDRKRALGLRLEDETQEQMLLHTALACASERVVASYSEVDLLSGRKRVLSLYGAELMKAARGSELDVRRLEEDAMAGASSRAGWPAPENPVDAIDEAEYDLASFRRAFKGDCAYLKENEHVARSLRGRYRRWKEKWCADDGLTQVDVETLHVLESFRLGAHAYSTSALQQFSVCPYKFVLRAIHGLQPSEAPAPLQRMDPAIRGSLYHETQFDFLRSCEGDFTCVELLDECLDRRAAQYEEDLAPAIPYVWKAEIESVRADLRGWAKKMTEQPEWQPVAYELSFGLTPDERHDAKSRPDAVTVLDKYLLRGSIDMVERHTTGMLRVVDHKTGSVPSPLPQFVGRGEVLQPLLYAMAAEQALGEGVVTGRLHYATLRSNYREIDVTVSELTRGIAGKALGIIDEALRTGFLPAAPRKEACENCDYRVVCGPYEEERSGKKSRVELGSLRELRGMK
jgi:ATP-dependent helicase/nuclease subunit B